MLRYATETLRQLIHPLTGVPTDYDPLLTLAREARVVVLGLESQGCHELLEGRSAITRRLIEELGFNVVASDCDSIAAARVGRYLSGDTPDTTGEEALRGFRRYPHWKMRNAEVLDFIGWMRARNDLLQRNRAQFTGLDVLGLYTTIETILGSLEAEDPIGASQARWRFSGLDQFAPEREKSTIELSRSREERLLRELIAARRSALDDPQLAELVDAAFYRALLHGDRSASTHRDYAMLHALSRSLDAQQKVVIWTSNVSGGDRRAMVAGPESSFGSLLRDRLGNACVLVGLTTYSGTVTASARWGAPPERLHLMPALPESLESLLYDIDSPKFLMTLRDKSAVEELSEPLLQRSVGPVYLPETERWSHYFQARLAHQFDALVHFDESRATEPL